MTHDQRQRPPGGTYPLAGRQVARIGYGAMQLENLAAGGGTTRREAALEVLRRGLALGIDHIDTAGFYGDQVVNELIRDALSPYPDELVIVSKIGARHVENATPRLVPAQRPEELRAAVESDLGALGVEQLAVVNLRRLDEPPGILAVGDQIVPLDDQLAELVRLRDEGLIGAIGLSQVSAEQVRAALPVGLACVQNRYNLVDPRDDALLALCREHEIAWVSYFPLGSAFPGRPKVVEQPEVVAAAAALEVTPAQVGLAWLLARSPNILLIPGTASLDHLAENVACGDVVLTQEIIDSLDALTPAAEA